MINAIQQNVNAQNKNDSFSSLINYECTKGAHTHRLGWFCSKLINWDTSYTQQKLRHETIREQIKEGQWVIKKANHYDQSAIKSLMIARDLLFSM
jgi:hypothetical protein